MLNAIIARLHAGQNALKISSELRVSIVIVIMVLEAYSNLKPMINDANVVEIIDYILNIRYNIRSLVEQNIPLKLLAKKINLSIEETKWFIWFVKASKGNSKL